MAAQLDHVRSGQGRWWPLLELLMGCPGCGHRLFFDFSAGYPKCGHCRYPDLPDDKRLYTDKPESPTDNSLTIDRVKKDGPGSEKSEPGLKP